MADQSEQRLTLRHQESMRYSIVQAMPAIVHRLKLGASGEVEVTTQQIQCAKLLIDRVLPALTSQEVVHAPPPALTEAQVISQLANLLASKPDLLALLGSTTIDGLALPSQEDVQAASERLQAGPDTPQGDKGESVLPSPNFLDEKSQDTSPNFSEQEKELSTETAEPVLDAGGSVLDGLDEEERKFMEAYMKSADWKGLEETSEGD